jgi:flagellar assembly protein FliH
MNTAPKFTFDTEFDRDADRPSPAARARQKKTLSAEEIDALCAAAQTEGETAAGVRAAEALDRNVAALTIAIRAALDTSHAEIEQVREDASRLALAIAAKLAPAAIAALPAAEVEAALRRVLHLAISEPRVTLTAAPVVIAEIEPKIAEIAAAEGYDGRVQLAADPALAGADCRIEWRGGGSERSGETIEQAIEALIAHRFSQPESVKG